MAKDRQQKHRQKRQQKRRIQQRASIGIPHRLAGEHGHIEGCYINKEWKLQGMAAIYVLKRVRADYVMGGFLVDTLCLGLKDAWGRLDVGPVSFRETVQEYGQNLEMMSTTPALAWRLIAGGVRIAQDNGFRLPPRYERWITILGDPAECASADLSDFGDENGKLHYIGSMEDLRRRLVNCTPEEFMSREDVEVTTEVAEDEVFADEDDGEASDDEQTLDIAELEQAAEDQRQIEGAIEELNQRTLDAARRWLFGQSIAPHPRLAEAINLQLEAMLQAKPVDETDMDQPSAELMGQVDKNLEQLLALEPPGSREELAKALDQYVSFVRQFKNHEEMFEAIGGDLAEDDT